MESRFEDRDPSIDICYPNIPCLDPHNMYLGDILVIHVQVDLSTILETWFIDDMKPFAKDPRMTDIGLEAISNSPFGHIEDRERWERDEWFVE